MPSKIQVAAVLGAMVASTQAHGILSAVKVDGTDFKAYNPSFQYQTPPPEVIEWSCPECQDNGFVDPTMYTDATKIACHKDATAGAKVAKVAAGGSIDITWNTWPESHNGPIIDYLAKVDDATKAKSTDLSFFKIDEGGFDGGKWATEKLIANDLTWSIKVPESIAPGQYVLRHEIIALHSAGQENGAQNYPKCLNIEVTGSGTETPEGVTADKLYTPTDPGIKVSIYGDNSGYKIPGPALFSGASSGSATSPKAPTSTSAAPASSASPASSAAPAASSAPASNNNAAAPKATGSAGSEDLPKTFTVSTFISWLEAQTGSKQRRHARSFGN